MSYGINHQLGIKVISRYLQVFNQDQEARLPVDTDLSARMGTSMAGTGIKKLMTKVAEMACRKPLQFFGRID